MKKLLLILLFIPLLFSCNLDADMGIFQDVLSSQKVDSTEIYEYIGVIGDTTYVVTQKGIQSFDGTDSETLYASEEGRIYGAVINSTKSGIIFHTFSTTTAEQAPMSNKFFYIDFTDNNKVTEITDIDTKYIPLSFNSEAALLYDKTAKEVALVTFDGKVIQTPTDTQDVSDIKFSDNPNVVQGGFSYKLADESYKTFVISNNTFVEVTTKAADAKFGKLVSYFETSQGKNYAISYVDNDIVLWSVTAGEATQIGDPLKSSSSFAKNIYMFETVNGDTTPAPVLGFFSPLISSTGTSMNSILITDNSRKDVSQKTLSNSTNIIGYAKLTNGSIRVITVDNGYYNMSKLDTDSMVK